MGAFVTLAFGWIGELEEYQVIHKALEGSGLRLFHIGRLGDGMHESSWVFPLNGMEIPLTVRMYSENGWIATSVDIEEELFDELGQRLGRSQVIEAFIHAGIHLLQALSLQYVFFEEEAEADFSPQEYKADLLMGITILADSVPGLNEAFQRKDIQHVHYFDGGVVIYRRMDPVPHYQP